MATDPKKKQSDEDDERDNRMDIDTGGDLGIPIGGGMTVDTGGDIGFDLGGGLTIDTDGDIGFKF